jgi:hypothetical protein
MKVLTPEYIMYLEHVLTLHLFNKAFCLNFFLNKNLQLFGDAVTHNFSGSMPSAMRLSGPQGLTVSAFQPDDLGRPSVMYADLSWTPSPTMNGINMVCFIAEDDSG